MPRVSSEVNSQYWEPVSTGPIAQVDLSSSAVLGTVPSSIVASGSWTSNVTPTDGFQVIAVGVTSSQAGVLSVQRYLDIAGLVAQGGPVTQAMTAATPAVLNCSDHAPCQSFKISITNASGSTAANITNFACLLNAA